MVAAAIVVTGTSLPAQTPGTHGVHPTPAPSVKAVHLTGAIKIDGSLEEAVWQTPSPATDFLQSQPNEGKAATQKTEVRFAYDDDALYIGAQMYDTEGAKGVRTRLMRRDAMTENDSDMLIFLIDSYHAHQSTFNFSVNPSNSKRDGIDGPTWDGVWESATKIDSLGWTAELRIPFSQLNFSVATDQTWGIQVIRFEHRLNERSHFAWWPNNEPGGPQRYGHLEGLAINKRPRGAELMPYVVGRSQFIKPPDPSNPFTKSSTSDYRAGGDVKYRLTSNLSLNATINPDFGQVEVDPAVVNLSAFETFFQEKRPFFVEGQNAFAFGNFNCFFCSNTSNLQMFYTRRIGRAPQIFPSANYVDQPENATILGAAKVTGRTAGGHLVGILDALTRRETARTLTTSNGISIPGTAEVEPMTNYVVARERKDFDGGAHQLGAIFTSVDRFSSDPLVQSRLVKGARSAGFDWFTSRNKREYSFMGQLAASDLRGTTSAIQRLERSSARYFQRPDRISGGNGIFSDKFSSDVTRLGGYGGYARVGKDAGTWLWEGMANFRSPGFEVNDISFLNKADFFNTNFNVARSVTKPGKFYRNYFMVAGLQNEVNYDGDRTDREYPIGIFGQLLNFWQMNLFTIRTPESFDDRATRGGPVVRKNGYRFTQAFISSDRRKALAFIANSSLQQVETVPTAYRVNVEVTWKPSSSIQLSVGPGYSTSNSPAQFVTSGADSTDKAFFGRRYIFAELAQKSLSMSTRANIVFTPGLTFEIFAQPLISSGDYRKFREYAGTRQSAHRDFLPASEINSTIVGGRRRYTVDVDQAGPAQPVTFFDPNFNFRSLRGNAVVRWEYKPGSTLFFVWQQSRSGSEGVGDFNFSRDSQALFGAHPDNIFLVKATYWLAR